MPNLKSAIKRTKQNKKRAAQNRLWKEQIKSAKRALLESHKKGEGVAEAWIALQKKLDKAAKRNVIHKNKATRTKARFSKLVSK